jgi:ABC-type phosphate transport system permease subunit
MKWRYFKQNVFFTIVRLSALLIALVLGGLLAYIIVNGASSISWDFITLPPTDSMTKGGIMPAILGTLYLTIGAIAVAMPLGVVSAIYLTEYAKQGTFVRLVRIGINCLAGVPSRILRCFSSVRIMHSFRSTHPWRPCIADNHRGVGRSSESGTANIPGGVACPRDIQMADHL